jgi:DNA methyltransferase 1-associated protein 1
MGDVAQILGDTSNRASAANNSGLPAPPPPLPGSHKPSKAMQMAGVSNEVMDLLAGHQDPSSAALPPMVPAFDPTGTNVKVGNKYISSSKKARPWAWQPFASSSRTDGAMFSHWVRANVEYTDYPYAKFDIHLDPVTYSEDEYQRFLTSETWTKSETDKLMELSRTHELRWPVIHDRWEGSTYSPRNVEDLMHRYYTVAAVVAQTRISREAANEVQALTSAKLPDDAPPEASEQLLMETAAAKALATAPPQHQPLIQSIGTGSTNKTFDLNNERERRAHMQRMWTRDKDEELEEMNLRYELKAVEAQLRKLKKSGGHIIAAGGKGGPNQLMGSANSSRAPSRAASPVPGAAMADNPDVLDECFSSVAPTPMPGYPYLQSGRLAPPATGGSVGLNKPLLARMDATMKELKVPKRPTPTKRVCDLYDSLRKDVLTLLTLRKLTLQHEGTLQSKRVKLSKLGGGPRPIMDEESLLGIAPPPPPAPAPASAPTAPASAKKTKPKAKGSATGKPKAAAASKKPSSTTPAASKPGDPKEGGTGTGNTAKKKKAVKRKRKSEDSSTKKEGGVAGAAMPKAAPSESTAPPPAKPSAAKPATSAGAPGGTSSDKGTAKKRARKS